MKYALVISMVLIAIASQVSGECWKQVAAASADKKCPAGYTYGGKFCWQDCPANQNYQYNCNFYCASNALSCRARATVITGLVAGKLGQAVAQTLSNPASVSMETYASIFKSVAGEKCA